MKDLKPQQENAIKVASIVEQLDEQEQQRAVDIVTSFALGVQSARIKKSKDSHSDNLKLKTR